MKRRWQQAARVACLALGLGLGSAEARIFDVEIESSGLAKLDIQLAFDFIDGGPRPIPSRLARSLQSAARSCRRSSQRAQ